METTVFQIELNDGRVFRVFCANKNQKDRVVNSTYRIKSKVKQISPITTGIHTASQYEKFLDTLHNP